MRHNFHLYTPTKPSPPLGNTKTTYVDNSGRVIYIAKYHS